MKKNLSANESNRLRQALGISQQQLADYLSLSRVQLTQAETGRRTMPAKTFAKLGVLSTVAATVDPTAETADTKKILDEAIKKPGKKAKQCEAQAISARVRLKEMKERYSQCSLLVQVCTVLLGRLPSGTAAKKDRLCLEIMKAGALKKMRTCNPVEQAVLQLQADGFTRQAQQLRAMIQ